MYAVWSNMSSEGDEQRAQGARCQRGQHNTRAYTSLQSTTKPKQLASIHTWYAYVHEHDPVHDAHGGTTASHGPMLYRHRRRGLLVERHVEPKIASIEMLLLLLLHPAPANRRARPRRQRRHPQARGDKPAPARAINEAPAKALDRVRRP